MSGAQDRWDRLTEPTAPGRDLPARDAAHPADQREGGLLGDLRRRLERLPPGHPSSPYNDDLTRKTPVLRLKDLELPLHGAENGPNGNGSGSGSAVAAGHGAGLVGVPSVSSTTSSSSTTTSSSSNNNNNNNNASSSSNGTHGSDAAAGRLDAANGLGVLSGRFGTAAAGEQDGNGFDRYPAAGPHAPASEPHEPAADPYDATDTYGAAASTYDEPADSYDAPADQYDAPADQYDATDTYDAAADPYEPAADPHEPAADPYESSGHPYEPAGHPYEPAGHPYEPAGHRYAPAREPLGAPGGAHRAVTEPFRAAGVAGHGWNEPEAGLDTITQAAVGAKTDDDADTPLIGQDGSWEWNGRYLTAEECHIADEALGRCRIAEGRNVFGGYGHSGLTPAMRRIEAQLEHGHLLPDTEDRALKRPDKLKQKLADLIMRHPDKSARELALEVPDGIRYAFIFEREHYADAAMQAHSRLRGSGFDLEVRRNCWDNAEYKGVSTRWRDPAHDLVFEVQFHTAESWAAVQRAHPLCEAMTDPATPPAERERLRGSYAEMSATVPVPPGATAIPEYRKDGA